MSKKILLGLSGGVDSTAAVLILKEKGYEVTGCFLDVTGSDRTGRRNAGKAAEQLGIELISKDVSREFERDVIDNFCNEYCRGRTPNPCVRCNPLIKFKFLADTADEIGCPYIGTGHYALTEEVNGITYVKRGKNLKKDQSYMLYRLDQQILKRLVMPLGEFETKEEIRDIARATGIFNAEHSDSMEICFIEDGVGYSEFMRERGYTGKKGNFIFRDGTVIAPHSGIDCYTLGQRKGLGIAIGRPAFVTEIDEITGNVIIGTNEELFKKEVFSTDNVFANPELDIKNGTEVKAEIRYGAKAVPAVINGTREKMRIVFKEAVRAATPGQSIVFYEEDRVVGGGFIL